MGKVRDRFGSMGRFKGGLSCKGWVNSVIIIYTLYKVGPEMLLTNRFQLWKTLRNNFFQLFILEDMCSC